MAALDCSLDAVKSRLKRARRGFEELARHFLKEKTV
jgi:DNA-directed RNA polymerase specialized sigma24 family protein